MTDEQINRAIALHLGWTGIVSDSRLGVIGVPPARNECDPVYLRNCTWTEDLNAMHKAEKVLGHILLHDYAEHISRRHDWEDLLTATARQRAEAFLRTLGKWEEVQG